MRILLDLSVAKIPSLKSARVIHGLITRSCGKLDSSPSAYGRLMAAPFRIGEVIIRGGQLLRFLGFGSHMSGFVRFVQHYFPKVAADRILTAYGHSGVARVLTFKNRRRDVLRSLGLDESSQLVLSQESYADKDWFSKIERPSGLLLDVPSWECWPGNRGGVLTELRWQETWQELTNNLMPFEIEVVKLRYGLDGEEALTSGEIAAKLNLTPAVVNHRARAALWRMRRSAEWRYKLTKRLHEEEKQAERDEERKRIEAEELKEELRALKKAPRWRSQWESEPIKGHASQLPFSGYPDAKDLLSSEKNFSLLNHPTSETAKWLCWYDEERDWFDCSEFFQRPLKAWKTTDGYGITYVHVLVYQGSRFVVFTRPIAY